MNKRDRRKYYAIHIYERFGNGQSADRFSAPAADRSGKQLAACQAGKGRAELSNTLKFLQDYTAKHFSDEEKLQLQSRYPDYVNHRKYHEDFKKVVAGICAELEKDGPTIVLVGKVNSTIAGWLINHIKKEDTKVAAHLKAVQKG